MRLARTVLAGHSFGCVVAVAVAPEPHIDIHGLALISSYYYPTTRRDVAISTPATIPVIGDVMATRSRRSSRA